MSVNNIAGGAADDKVSRLFDAGKPQPVIEEVPAGHCIIFDPHLPHFGTAGTHGHSSVRLHLALQYEATSSPAHAADATYSLKQLTTKVTNAQTSEVILVL